MNPLGQVSCAAAPLMAGVISGMVFLMVILYAHNLPVPLKVIWRLHPSRSLYFWLASHLQGHLSTGPEKA